MMWDILLLVGRRLQGTSHFTRVIIRGETDPLLVEFGWGPSKREVSHLLKR
jgi:hypothetical protein